MATLETASDGPFAEFIAIYDSSLAAVYGYLLHRVGRNVALAEDLTSETFTAAATAVRKGSTDVNQMSTPWLIGVARHKLVDHWRAIEREERKLSAVAATIDELSDPWDDHIDALRARALLARLSPQHRSVLTLRYVDGLGVAQVAATMNRTVHATESLLQRAKRALRTLYIEQGGDE